MTNTSSIAHTPGEWKYYKRDGESYTIKHCRGSVFTPGDILIAETYTTADAAYIVQAVNAFPHLVAALTAFLDHPVVSGSSAHFRDESKRLNIPDPIVVARAALADATGDNHE